MNFHVSKSFYKFKWLKLTKIKIGATLWLTLIMYEGTYLMTHWVTIIILSTFNKSSFSIISFFNISPPPTKFWEGNIPLKKDKKSQIILRQNVFSCRCKCFFFSPQRTYHKMKSHPAIWAPEVWRCLIRWTKHVVFHKWAKTGSLYGYIQSNGW